MTRRPLKPKFWSIDLHEKEVEGGEMWAGFPDTDVLLPTLRSCSRTSSLCCLHSRHLHSWHSCLQSFKGSALSLRLLDYDFPLPLCLFVSFLCSEFHCLVAWRQWKRVRKERQQKERKKKWPWWRRDESCLRSEQRKRPDSSVMRFCLGCLRFLWPVCSVNIPSVHGLRKNKYSAGTCVFFNKKRTNKLARRHHHIHAGKENMFTPPHHWSLPESLCVVKNTARPKGPSWP